MYAGDAGVWPIAGAAAPRVKPPANAAPLLRNSLRAGRFEPMSLSFSAEPARPSLPRLESIRPGREWGSSWNSAVFKSQTSRCGCVTGFVGKVVGFALRFSWLDQLH